MRCEEAILSLIKDAALTTVVDGKIAIKRFDDEKAAKRVTELTND